MLWTCTVCGYVADGDEPPDKCPVCGAGKDKFVPKGGGGQKTEGGEPQDLEQVRQVARQRLEGTCAVYPWCDGRPENVCNREAYGRPIGMGGAGSGSSFRANVDALSRLRLRTRVVGEHLDVDSSVDFLGHRLAMPIMAASSSGIESYGTITEAEFNVAVVEGCVAASTIGWRGDTHFYEPGNHGGLEAISGVSGQGVQIFKPRQQDELKRLIEEAERVGCLAVGVDLDGCGSTNFARAGKPVYRKSVAQLHELVRHTSLPFVAKGVMTVEDAEACVEAGVRVVGVSNHGGRVLDSTPGVAEVLAEIARSTSGEAVVAADGGVRTGYDVLKMLALGADVVLVGRDVIRAAVGGGARGVQMQMERLRDVLAKAMLVTGCGRIEDVGQEVIATGSPG